MSLRLKYRAVYAIALLSAAVITVPAVATAGFSGAEKARTAGIAVDPGAEKAMEEAPVGSCFNDPTQAKRPKVRRVAATVTSDSSEGFTGYAFGDSSAASSADVSAAAIPQCFVKSDPPFFAAGLAQGNGAQNCSAAVSYQELYVSLYDYISTGRRNLDTRVATGSGGRTLRGSPKFNCNHAVSSRKYQTEADGYAVLQGVWYAATQRDCATFKCPY